MLEFLFGKLLDVVLIRVLGNTWSKVCVAVSPVILHTSLAVISSLRRMSDSLHAPSNGTTLDRIPRPFRHF